MRPTTPLLSPAWGSPRLTMRATPGDWIIKGVKGEVYACKPDIFEQTYEPVEDPK